MNLASRPAIFLAIAFATLPLGCASDAAPPATPTVPDASPSSTLPPGAVPFSVTLPGAASGDLLAVRADGVRLADAPEAAAWDLRVAGDDLFTNGGASGPGLAAAIGPLDGATFLADTPPATPLFADAITGSFLDWYLYEGSPNHVLWSRYHRYVVARGERRWLVQVLGYYGVRDGAPLGAIYALRVRDLDGSGEGVTYTDIDGTAGGATGDASTPSDCLALATGAKIALPAAAVEGRTDVDLCFRRQAIRVAPGAIAVDLDAAATANEALATVKSRTAASEAPRFAATTARDADGARLLPDGLRSAFTGAWLTPDGAVAPGTWVLRGADGTSQFFLTFTAFTAPRAGAPGALAGALKRVR